MNRNKRAFTLIELLVVVVIIAILAAVALPQYQWAVVKTRISSQLPLLKSMADAQEVYYLEHGSYARKPEQLGVQFPTMCRNIISTGNHAGEVWSCEKDTVFYVSSNYVLLNYCPGASDDWDLCLETREMGLAFYYAYSSKSPGKRTCFPSAGNLCKRISKIVPLSR